MSRRLPGVLLCLTLATALGCMSGERKADALKSVEKPPEPVKPAFNPDPETWAKAELYKVWPYGNGEVAGWLGARQGLRKGDYLILSRDGVRINTVLVLRVFPDTFYGRVLERGPRDVAPQVGDIAIKGPQPMMSRPVKPVAEKDTE